MARTKTLKVYRTVAGFYDAYVAAPSQKAALEAWGSDRDLFARGIAEQVTDPALTAEPLAAPGTVVKHSRGTTAEQIAALPDPKPAGKKTVEDGRVAEAATTKSKASVKSEPPQPKPKPKPKPKPSSEALDAAEAALATTESEYAKQARSLAEREARLAQERRAFDRDRAAALEKAQGARDDARQRYDAALKAWRASRR